MGNLLRTTFAVLLVFVISGCASVGPRVINRDRFDYVTALSDSWKRQMLLTIVMIRYGYSPVFLDVASVISQYSLETEVGGRLFWNLIPYGDGQEVVSGSARYIDRPTITYTPLSGEAYARTLMKPIPLTGLLNLINGGYPIDLVLMFGIHSINDVRNRYGGAARARPADPEFYPLLEEMLRAQKAEALGLRLKEEGTQRSILLVFRKTDGPGIQEDLQSIRKILGLNPEAMEFTVVASSIPKNDTEIAILTRSLTEILVDLGSDVEVPAINVEAGRTSPTRSETMPDGTPVPPFIVIHSSKEKSSDAFVEVSFQGYWYWIDDKDLPSKGRFSFLRAVFALTETGGERGTPIVTIPAG